MIYLLLGKDDYSKKQFLKELQAKEQAAALEYFYEWNEQAVLGAVRNFGLFAKKQIAVIFGQLGKFDFAEFIEKIKDTPNILVFIEDALDKRKTETKKILADKNIKTVEFEIPAGAELRKWVQERAKQIGLKLNVKALDLLLARLGADSAEGERLYNLWQVNSELSKLKIFAGSSEVQPKDIDQLVSENLEENIFKITNAIGDKNKTETIRTLTEYMDRLPGDEKTKVISLSGILAEQFRGILTVQGLLAERHQEAMIMKQTGYSPGRLFVYKKIAKNFKGEKIIDALRKLELLDEEIKTSQGPAALQFLMIINALVF